MENAGSGATMSPGVATPVASSMRSSEARIEPASPEQSRRVSVSEEVRTIEPNVRKDETGMAHALIVIAKRDGVDEALEELARDDDVREETKPGRTVDGVKTKDVQEGEFEDDQDRKPNMLDQEVHELAAKVEKFAQDHGDLKERLKQVEEMNQLAMLTIYEMAQILKKMIEDSEEENKQNLLMLLAHLMAKLMEMMFVPDEEDGVADGQTSEERALEKMAA